MPVGDTQNAFAEAAGRDGIQLVPQRVDWLNQRGHLGLPDDGARHGTVAALEKIYLALGGDLATLAGGRTTPLPGDFIHPAAMGRPPLIRVDAADRDPADAYRRHRDRLRMALGL